MKTRKLLSIILSGALALSVLAGCSSGNGNSGIDSQETTSTAASDQSDTQESIAQSSAADATGGDLFELEPVEPYTDEDLNYGDENSRVSREHEDESLRDVELVSTTVENWDSYDTVFIGYPIWWGIAAWPVDSFVENNDFTGKTVIPFATSASSDLGESGQLLADLAGTGDWQVWAGCLASCSIFMCLSRACLELKLSCPA